MMRRLPGFLGCCVLLASVGCERSEMAQRINESPEAMERRMRSIAARHIASHWESRSVPLEGNRLELNPTQTYVRLSTHTDARSESLTEGVFMELDGHLRVDPETHALQSLSLTMPATSLLSGRVEWTEALQEALVQQDTGSATVGFESTSVSKLPRQDHYAIEGVFTMRGQSLPVTLDADVEAHDGRIGLIGEFAIDRTTLGFSSNADPRDDVLRFRIVIPELASVPDDVDDELLVEEIEESLDAPGARGSRDPAAFFSSRDRDGDGLLTDAEIPTRMASRLASIDTDKDQSISRAEFLAQIERRRQRDSDR